jgi:hemolysin D
MPTLSSPPPPSSTLSPGAIAAGGRSPASGGTMDDIEAWLSAAPGDLAATEAMDDTWSDSTQELLDTFPQRWSRGLLYLMMGFTAIVLPWAAFSKVDEIGTARGRLEPKGKTIRLDAPVTATVAQVSIQEGQQAKAGQRLVELQSETVQAEVQQVQARLTGLRQQALQLKQMQRQLQTTLRTQTQQNEAQAAEQESQIEQVQERIAASLEGLTVVRSLIAQDQVRVQRLRELQEQGIIAKVQVEEAERTLLETSQRLQQAMTEVRQSQAELQKQKSSYDRILRIGDLALLDTQKQIQTLETDIAVTQTDIAQATSQLQALQVQQRQRILKAPVAGTVFRLTVPSAGMVVQPGQMIAQIAPKGAPLVIRAQIDSRESGFLRVGLPAKVKFDAYPFQDYGVVMGRVRWVSPDSKRITTEAGQREVFELEVELPRPYIQTPTKRIALTPGQTATVEVIIRQRRIMDYMLDPFRTLQKGGLDL